MPIEKLQPSFSIAREKIEELKQIIPEAFADNKINWESLKQALGENLEDDEIGTEHFGLFWPGKRVAKTISSSETYKTLEPDTNKGIDIDLTKNIFIEGENLEVLKIILKSYIGKIKLIYIDPPYNTGNDFVYEDNFVETVEEYLTRSGQIDESNRPLHSNKKSDGRYHSKWLSMMYPRLKVSRNLLTEDGVIFISIDDNEFYNLRMLMNELYGEENYIGTFVIQSNPRGSQSTKDIAIVHEYILAFAKNISSNPRFGLQLNEKMKSEYKYTLDDGSKYRLLGLRQRGGAWRKEQRPSLYFPIYVNPTNEKISLSKDRDFTIEVYPVKPTTGELGSWRWSKNKIELDIELLIGKEIKRNDNVEWDIYQIDKLIRDDDEKTTKPKSIWNEKELNYQDGTTTLKQLFNGESVFDFPKPVYLIKKLIEITNLENSEILLDFFAGSGTSAEAVIQYNLENECSVNFINIQLNEKNKQSNSVFETLSDVTYERIKRCLAKNKDKSTFFDMGCRYFKLSNSDLKRWKDILISDTKNLEEQFEIFTKPTESNWTEQKLMNEILLTEGFTLDSSISKQTSFDQNNIYLISCDYYEHSLLICLDEELKEETINQLVLKENDIFVCFDNSIGDENKAILADKGLIKTI